MSICSKINYADVPICEIGKIKYGVKQGIGAGIYVPKTKVPVFTKS